MLFWTSFLWLLIVMFIIGHFMDMIVIFASSPLIELHADFCSNKVLFISTLDFQLIFPSC